MVLKMYTDRLILRRFKESDIEALYQLLSDEEVNTFLPWFPIKTIEETYSFYEDRFKYDKYAFAICLKENDYPIGYIKVSEDESHDLGYALRKEHWHKGITSEAARVIVDLVKKEGLPYITATHDIKNIRSGRVMESIGMTYRYSYEKFWKPKNYPVIFKMYQLSFNDNDETYLKYLYENDINKIIEAKEILSGLADIKEGRTFDGESSISSIRKKYGI